MTYVRTCLCHSWKNFIVSALIVSVVRIAFQAPSKLPLRPLPLYPRPSSSLPLPLPPLSVGQGVAGEAFGVSCARSWGGGGGGVVAGTGAVSAGPSLTGGWGGGSAEIPPSQPSPVLARSPPLPGPSELLVCDSRSRSRNSGGLLRERTRSHSPHASGSSSRTARGE